MENIFSLLYQFDIPGYDIDAINESSLFTAGYLLRSDLPLDFGGGSYSLAQVVED